MRILLHIGMTKTGSTALQTTFTRHAATLAEAGVLYPRVRSHPVSHSFLGLVLCPPTQLPRVFASAYATRPDLIRPDFDAQWADVKRQIRKHKPHTLLLSSEILFMEPEAARAESLRAAFAEVADTLEIVAYVRQPSAYFLSRVQQNLKSAASILQPGPVSFRKVAETYARLFDAPVRLAPYDRATLARGDVVSDFCARFLPGVTLPASAASTRVNESLSAELMALLQDYRRVNHPHADHVITTDTVRYRRLLQKLEAAAGGSTRPCLHAEIATYIDHASVDLVWLAETYGIRFEGINYAAIGTPESDPYSDLKRVDQLCAVDPIRMQHLQLRAMHARLVPRMALPRSGAVWLTRNINTRSMRLLRVLLRPLRKKLHVWY